MPASGSTNKNMEKTMSDFPEKPTAKDTKSGQAWRMPKIAAVATAVVLATGVVATQTFAGSWGGPGWRAGAFLNAPITQAGADKRIKRIVRHMAIEVDATLEQQG